MMECPNQLANPQSDQSSLSVQINIVSLSIRMRPLKIHYENTPIQIYRKFLLQIFKIFRHKNCDIFHISARNIHCGYSLEPPRRGGSNEYPQSMF